ncbi:MAG TPA: DUF6064 family protein [Gemmatimonadales bacterium]|nr:DUF6064 family protein [Gemmatimonadales bacterium]
MRLPFTTAQFLELFRAYNLAVWPAQVLLYLLGLALVVIAARSTAPWGRWAIAFGLAVLWAWIGAVYHLGFFVRINPAARLFGIAFLVQAVLWLVWVARVPSLRFRPGRASDGALGAAMLAYAFVFYPLLNLAFGHAYPRMPTFGLPCPTTIATFGLVTWATPRPPWYAWVIPVAWALIASSAAFTLGIREDFGLLAAMLLALASRLAAPRAPGLHPART